LDPVFRQKLAQDGAVFGAEGVLERFRDAEAELRAAFQTCALADRSELARLVGTGPDLLPLLNRLSTGAVSGLEPGEGKPTVLTTAKGRIVDRLFVHRLDGLRVLLCGGSNCAESIMAHLTRYTFAERTELTDVSPKTFQFVLIGPSTAGVLRAVGVELPGAHRAIQTTVAGHDVDLIGQNGLEGAGCSIIGDAANTSAVWDAIAAEVRSVRGCPAGHRALESYRLLRGLPASGHELTEEHNPLEAGLSDAVSFDKGCYVGQEVVARLQTYDKVSRSLVGLEFAPDQDLPKNGTPLLIDGRNVGVVTSAIVPPGSERGVALAYVKRKELRAGLTLELGPDGPPATCVDLPFPIP
jgi:folate-binding protein YgfZ